MRTHTKRILLAVFDGILALGAVWVGLSMILSLGEIYDRYPPEWLNKLPFTSWIVPGILAIAVFGLGNGAAAFCALRAAGRWPWLPSLAMGAVLFMSFVAQIVILGECYLATVEFLILAVLQMALSVLSRFGAGSVQKKKQLFEETTATFS